MVKISASGSVEETGCSWSVLKEMVPNKVTVNLNILGTFVKDDIVSDLDGSIPKKPSKSKKFSCSIG